MVILNNCIEYRIEQLEAMNQCHSNYLAAIAICVSVFIAMTVFMSYIFGFKEPQKAMAKMETKMQEMESKMVGYEGKIKKLLEDRLNELRKQDIELEGMSLRNSYEGAAAGGSWKFIWSIRYSHWFYKNMKSGLNIRIKAALEDFVNVPNKDILKRPEISEELKEKLHDLESSSDEEVKSTATQIITKFYNL